MTNPTNNLRPSKSFSWADDEEADFDFDTWLANSETSPEDTPISDEIPFASPRLNARHLANIANEVRRAQDVVLSRALDEESDEPAWPMMSYDDNGTLYPGYRVNYASNWNHFKAREGVDCRVLMMMNSSGLREVTNVDDIEDETMGSLYVEPEDSNLLLHSDSADNRSLDSWERSDEEDAAADPVNMDIMLHEGHQDVTGDNDMGFVGISPRRRRAFEVFRDPAGSDLHSNSSLGDVNTSDTNAGVMEVAPRRRRAFQVFRDGDLDVPEDFSMDNDHIPSDYNSSDVTPAPPRRRRRAFQVFRDPASTDDNDMDLDN